MREVSKRRIGSLIRRSFFLIRLLKNSGDRAAAPHNTTEMSERAADRLPDPPLVLSAASGRIGRLSAMSATVATVAHCHIDNP